MRRPSLNHAYRLVWNPAAEAFVPAAETARGRGKSGRRALVEAVAGTLLALGAGSALATPAGSCQPGTTAITINGAETTTCVLNAGNSLTINGSLVVGSAPAVVAVSGPVGDIVNNGSISGVVGILVPGTSVNSITNAGAITSVSPSIQVGGSTVTGGITNKGTLTSTMDAGIAVDASNVGGINNSGSIGGLGNGVRIISSDIAGINNSGTMASTATNSGSMSGNLAGLHIGGSSNVTGGLVNSGEITGYEYGVTVHGSSTINGGLANSGTIAGGNGSGIEVNGSSAINGGLTNSGLIAGGDSGIEVDNSSSINGGLINKGLIAGGTGIYVGGSSSINGGLTNSGTIAGVDYTGIYLGGSSSINGGLINSGLIAGDNTGIYMSSSSISGGLVNSGTIAGGDTGIYVGSGASITGGLVNSGTIAGGEYALKIYGDVPTLTITGNDTARFIGEVLAFNTEVIVASGATYTMRGGELFTVGGMVPFMSGPSSSGFINKGTLAVAADGVGAIDGNYTQAADATFTTHVASADSYGKLAVSGTATLAHNALITVAVDRLGSLNGGSLAGVISAGSLDSDGTFVTKSSTWMFDATAVKNGDAVDVTLVKKGSAAQVATGNPAARGAVRMLDRLVNSRQQSELADLFFNLPDADALNDALAQSLPLLVGASQTAATNALGDIGRVLQSRLDAGRGQSSGEAFYTEGAAWLKPFGSWADQDDRNGVSGYEANTVGLVVGVDGKVSDSTRLGVSFAYAKVDIDGNSSVARNNADVDVYQLMGYGSRDLDANTALDFQVGFGKNMNSGERRIGFTHDVAKSNYESLTATLGAGLSRVYSLGEKSRFTPSVRADYTWIQDENYHETGADILNLKVKGRDTDSLIVAVDGKYSLEFQPATVFSANLGVGYDLLNEDDSITSAYAGAPNAFFRTEGIDSDPWLVRAGLGLSKTVGTTEVSLRYDLERRADFLNQSASVKVRWAF